MRGECLSTLGLRMVRCTSALRFNFSFLLLCALVLNVFHRICYYYCVCFDFVFCVFVTYFNIFYGFHRFECFCTETVAIYVFCFVVFVVYLHGL